MSTKPESKNREITIRIGSKPSADPDYDMGEPETLDISLPPAPQIETVGVFNLAQACRCGATHYVLERDNNNQRYRAKCGGCEDETKFYPWPGNADQAINKRVAS